MARILIVGCGCRGRELARALVADGHAVRGTTRSAASTVGIAAVKGEGVVADPDRLATLLPRLDGVSVVTWLLGSAAGDPEAVEALHGPRLRSLLDHLVDAPVRGFVYEAAGTVPAQTLAAGAEIVRDSERTHRLPTRVVTADPTAHPAWLTAHRQAVAELLSGRRQSEPPSDP